MAEFKDRLRELRIEKGLTQQELGDAIGLHGMSISGYERGVKKPSFKALDDLAEALNVSLDYLLGNSDTNSGYPHRPYDFTVDSPDGVIELHKELQQMNELNNTALMTAYLSIIKAYNDASPDTQAAVRAILHVQEEPDGDS